MERRLASLFLVVVVGLSVATLGGAAPPDDARLTITGVGVSPETPVTDEPVTLSVSLRNSAGSPSAVDVDTVLVRAPGNRTVARATDLGTLSPGDTLSVPLSTTFEEAGVRRLTVVAFGTDGEGNLTRVTRPLTVVVERAPPQVDLSVGRAVAGRETAVDVRVSNPTTAPVRNLTVSVGGGNLTPVDGRATLPELGAGETEALNLSVRAADPGRRSLRVTVAYTTAAGVPARTARERTVEVTPREIDVGVRAVAAPQQQQTQQVPGGLSGVLGGGATTERESGEDSSRVEVTVTNFGNAVVRDVVVEPRAGDLRLPRQAVAPALSPGESTAVTVDLSRVDRPAPVEFAVTYRAGEESHTATGVYDHRPGAGRVRITGVEMTAEGDRVRISGNAGNVGENEVTGVVLSVGESATVTPAYPQRTYFAGTIDGSEFAPFELTARVDVENASTVPVTVEYRVGGDPVNRTVELPVDETLGEEQSGGGGGLLSPLAVGLVAVAVLVVVVGAVVLRRRRG